MCGIAGLLSVDPDPELPRRLQPVAQQLRHRGPDGAGAWASPSGHAAFAHTRLAIFDTTTAGAQPMSVDARYTVVYNGATYNFTALRRELEGAGVRFTTRSDTEVVLRLYQRHGVAAFARLRGMFALAIWDETERACVLARDRFGIKPLYLAEAGGCVAFASEVRALRASGVISGALDPEAVYGYFRFGSVPEPRTILAGVRALPAGHCLTWRAGRATEAPFARLPFPIPDAEAAGAELHDVMADSVHAHLAGDVPIGVLLSGGVDSTVLLALARRAGSADVHSLTMALPGTADDEGPAARQTATRLGSIHHERAVTAALVRTEVPPFVGALDQPSIDGLNVFIMARLAAEHGIKAVLSGIGADELFGGYPSFQRVPQLAAWHRGAHVARPLAAGAGRWIERLAPGARSRRIGDLLQQPPGLLTSYETFRGIFTRREAAALTVHLTGHGPAVDSDATSDGASVPSEGDAVTLLELTRYVRNQLLRDADSAAMACGVEVRTPYLDGPLVSALASLPAGARVAAGKGLLRRMAPGLPTEAPHRKLCFQFPFATWLGSDWRDLAIPDVPAGVRTDTWYRQWSVFILGAWLARQGMTAHA